MKDRVIKSTTETIVADITQELNKEIESYNGTLKKKNKFFERLRHSFTTIKHKLALFKTRIKNFFRPKEIYCYKCRYYRKAPKGFFDAANTTNVCLSNENIIKINTPIKPKYELVSIPEHINRTNDCAYFRRNWWIFRFVYFLMRVNRFYEVLPKK